MNVREDEQIDKLVSTITGLYTRGVPYKKVTQMLKDFERIAVDAHRYRKMNPAAIVTVAENEIFAPTAEQIESIAVLVYEAMSFEQPQWVPWVVGGNSNAQDHARRIARRILAVEPVK